jgi:hypothetical protein
MKQQVRAFALCMATVAAATVTLQGTAFAKAYCERYAGSPAFDGTGDSAFISGRYWVVCSRTVSRSTLYGRIKEDRTAFPDVVHDTESFTFTGSKSDYVEKQTCQNNDSIYIEAQIDSEAPAQSSRRTQHC